MSAPTTDDAVQNRKARPISRYSICAPHRARHCGTTRLSGFRPPFRYHRTRALAVISSFKSGVLFLVFALSLRPYTLLVIGLLAITSIPSRVRRARREGTTPAFPVVPNGVREEHVVSAPLRPTNVPGALATNAVDRSETTRESRQLRPRDAVSSNPPPPLRLHPPPPDESITPVETACVSFRSRSNDAVV